MLLSSQLNIKGQRIYLLNGKLHPWYHTPKSIIRR